MNQKPADLPAEDIDRLFSLIPSGSKYLNILAMFSRNLNTPPSILEKLAKSKNKEIRKNIAKNPNTSMATLEVLAMDRVKDVRIAVAKNENTDLSVLLKLQEDKVYDVQYAAENTMARHPKAPAQTLANLAKGDLRFKSMFLLGNLAENPKTPMRILKRFMKTDDVVLRLDTARNIKSPHVWLEELAEEMAKDGYSGKRSVIAGEAKAPLSVLEKLAEDSEEWVRQSVAENVNAPLSLLEKLAEDSEKGVRSSVAKNANTPLSLLEKLSKDNHLYVRVNIAKNANTPLVLLEKLAEDSEEWVRSSVAENANTPLSLLEKLAEDSEEGVRSSVAENANTPLVLLEKLAEDSEEGVRNYAFTNPNNSASVHLKLFKDKDVYMREWFAEQNDISFDLLVKLAISEVSDDKDWHRNDDTARTDEESNSLTDIDVTMTKGDARKIKSVIKKKMNANVSELRSNFAYASMERWTLKQAFDFIKIEKKLVEEILDEYDSELHACSKSDFKNLCEEVYAELSLKYS